MWLVVCVWKRTAQFGIGSWYCIHTTSSPEHILVWRRSLSFSCGTFSKAQIRNKKKLYENLFLMLEHALYLYYVFHITPMLFLLANILARSPVRSLVHSSHRCRLGSSRYTLYLLLMCTKMVVFLCFIQFRWRIHGTNLWVASLKPLWKFICISFWLAKCALFTIHHSEWVCVCVFFSFELLALIWWRIRFLQTPIK